jgi:chorismate mutase / prephenate dehydratase
MTDESPTASAQPEDPHAQAENPHAQALDAARAQLDVADRELLAALRARMDAVRVIGSEKHRHGRGPGDRAREQQVQEKWVGLARELELNPHASSRVLAEILDWSRREQEAMWRPEGTQVTRVAFQGATDAHSDLAARRLMSMRGATVETVGCRSFDGAVAALLDQSVDYAFLPIENTIAGAIDQVDALLLAGSVHVVDEEIWPVKHALVALPGARVEQLKKVYSHPVALRQCRESLLNTMGLEVEEVWDTAGAADAVRSGGDPSLAAVCSPEAAASRGLEVLREDLSDYPNNCTRFLLLARDPEKIPPTIPVRTTLQIIASHQPGSLARCLGAFADAEINLTRLVSRVIPQRPGQHAFLIDLEGHPESERVAAALSAVRQFARQLRVIGVYPNRSVDAAKVDKPATPCVVVKVERKSTSSLPLASGSTKGQRGSEIAGVPIGGKDFVLIAGPCAVESREQIQAGAQMAMDAGARLLRGGAFKPRTSTYSFQGLGIPGVDLLVEAGHARGLPVVTEVLQARDVDEIAARADVLQVGARNMQNFELLRALGKIDRPVLLKRGMSATIDEWLHAAEYILAGGNLQVVLCERGIRTFETATRATLDISAIPVLRERTHLPIIVDPSHAAGRRELVVPLALAAVAAGADGLIVECHPNPAEAKCDKEQALRESDLAELVAGLEPILAAQGRRMA